MRSRAVLAALAVLAAAAAPARPPDVKIVGHAVMARRGSLGADDYVATNVYPCASAYALHAVRGGRLRDRAVNVVAEPDSCSSFVLPARRAARGFAKGFMLTLAVSTNTVLRFEGPDRLFSADGPAPLAAEPGETLLSFIEVAEGALLVEARSLSELNRE